MKDAASRIADMTRETEYSGEPAWSRERIARDIRSAISRAVKSERERCVKCVWNASELDGSSTMRELERQRVCGNIIKAINTPATKRPSRKRK